MAAQPQPSAGGLSPPPDLPNLPKTEDGLVNWLRTFSLWCRQGFAAKLDAGKALPGVMVQSTDQAVANPPVWMFGVDSGGTATLAPVALGTGKAGAPVPIGSGVYQPAGNYALKTDLTPKIAFSATMSAGQSVPVSAWTVINFDTLDFSVGGGYSTVNHRFQPNVAGYYQFNLSAGSATGAVTGILLAGLFKNGAEVARGMQFTVAGVNYYFNHISKLIHLNGTTDYVQPVVYFGVAATVGPDNYANWFNGALVVAA